VTKAQVVVPGGPTPIQFEEQADDGTNSVGKETEPPTKQVKLDQTTDAAESPNDTAGAVKELASEMEQEEQ